MKQGGVALLDVFVEVGEGQSVQGSGAGPDEQERRVEVVPARRVAIKGKLFSMKRKCFVIVQTKITAKLFILVMLLLPLVVGKPFYLFFNYKL